MKKLLSLALALVLCLSLTVPAMAAAGDDDVVILFDSAARLNSMISSQNLVVEYCESENALQLAAYGAGYNDPYISFSMSGLGSVNADTHKYVVLTYRMPNTNSNGNGTKIQQIYLQTANDAAIDALTVTQPYFALETGYKYRSYILDLSNTSTFPNYRGNLTAFRLDPFWQNMQTWDTLFVSSLVFCSSLQRAQQVAAEQTARANGSINSLPESSLSGNYGADLSPVWGGTLAYNEHVFVSDLKCDTPVSLLYDIERVLSVRDSTLGTEYQYGRDYKVANGKLIIPSNGLIASNVAPDADWFHRPTQYTEDFWPSNDGGGYIFVSDAGLYQQHQIVVTYTHAGGFPGSAPATKLNELPYAAYRFNQGIQETIVYFGDSITVGCFASSLRRVAPFCPIWADMTTAKLNAVYSNNVVSYNEAVGGKTSSWGAQNVSLVTSHNPDLVVLGFGMNDQNQVSVASYKANIKSIIDSVRDANPLCEFLLVSSMIGNSRIYQSYNTVVDYRAALNELAAEYEGVAVADVTAVHQALLSRKDFYDMSSNGINHCNDYMARVYAQVMIASLTGNVEIISPETVPQKILVSADRIVNNAGTDLANVGNNDPNGTDIGVTDEPSITAKGWLASSKTITRFGYRYGSEVVLDSGKASTEAAVTKAGLPTAGLFGETSRFAIQIPLRSSASEVWAVAELSNGAVVDMWRILYSPSVQPTPEPTPDPGTPAELLGSSFEAIYEDDTALCTSNAPAWLAENSVSYEKGSVTEIRLGGWAKLNLPIAGFGYRLDNGDTVYGIFEDSRDGVPVGATAFRVHANVYGLWPGEHTIQAVVVAEDDTEFVVASMPLTVVDPPQKPELTHSQIDMVILENDTLYDANNPGEWTLEDPITFTYGEVSSMFVSGLANASEPITGFGYSFDGGYVREGRFLIPRENGQGICLNAPLYQLEPGTHSVDLYAITESGVYLPVCSFQVMIGE